MATTISDGLVTITPALLLGYETRRESLNIIHDLLGGGIAVSLRGLKPRSGTLTFLFATEVEADSCIDLHVNGTEFTLADSALTSINMTYVLSGSIGAALEDQTREFWQVTVDYQEVV